MLIYTRLCDILVCSVIQGPILINSLFINKAYWQWMILKVTDFINLKNFIPPQKKKRTHSWCTDVGALDVLCMKSNHQLHVKGIFLKTYSLGNWGLPNLYQTLLILTLRCFPLGCFYIVFMSKTATTTIFLVVIGFMATIDWL